MTTHFQTGIELNPVELIVSDDLYVNEQRAIYASAMQNQIIKLQGNKFALLCMRRVSLYDTYELAQKARSELSLFDSYIFLPR